MLLLDVPFHASSVPPGLVADGAAGRVLHIIDPISPLGRLGAVAGLLNRHCASLTFLTRVVTLSAVNFNMIDQDLSDLAYLDLNLAQILHLLEAEIAVSQNQIFELAYVV